MPFSIPPGELIFRASRAGGPGGQHVNKASTRIEALWDVERTAILSEAERQRVRTKLASRIGADGLLRVVAEDRRRQLQNRLAAVERLERLVDDARRAPKPRKATRPTRASREKRLESKRRRSGHKQQRARRNWED
jgi:ribosome-associated protein